MARPRKQGLDYFPLDLAFFDDDKICVVGAEFGAKGEIAAVKLLIAIYRSGYYLEWNELTRSKVLKDLRGTSSETLDMIVRKLLKYGFFDEKMFDEFGILTSRGIQERYFEAAKFRKLDPTLPFLLIIPENYSKEKPVSQEKTMVSQEKTAVSQGKTLDLPTEKPRTTRKRVAKFLAREDFLKKFFVKANEASILSVCSELNINMDQFVEYAKAVVNEWQLQQKFHFDYSDAAANLISHIRCKATYSRPQAASIPAGYSRDDVKIAESRRRRDEEAQLKQQAEQKPEDAPLKGEALNDWLRSRGIEPGDVGGSLQRMAALERENAEAAAIADLRARFGGE